jgi:DNA invertase Pin-like site-specific DNA recombinase
MNAVFMNPVSRGLRMDYLVDLSALLSNPSDDCLQLWNEPLPVTPPAPSSLPRGLQRQTRLTEDQVKQLIDQHQAGSTVRQLAVMFCINRETVMEHLKRAGVSRRPNVRKLTDEQVTQAARIYRDGLSLQRTAEQFGISERTIRTELARAGEPIRPRRGWA